MALYHSMGLAGVALLSILVTVFSAPCGPILLPKFDSKARCPDNASYWSVAHQKRKLRDAPNCQHELGIQLLWNELARRDFGPGKVAAHALYPAVVFSASPSAVLPSTMNAQLESVSVSFIPRHQILGATSDAEIEFLFRGQLTVKIVFLLKVANASTSKLVSWLLEDPEPPSCSWWKWLLSWFTCPTPQRQLLSVHSLVKHRQLAYHYAQSGCTDTFVLLKPMRIRHEQAQQLRKMYNESHTNNVTTWLNASAVAVGVVLSPEGTFTVFDSGELLTRKIFYGGVVASGFGLVLDCYFCIQSSVEQRAYEVNLNHLLLLKRLAVAMIVDHWLSYVVAIVVVCVAYIDNLINRRTGAPWEYHMIFAAWLMVHCLHEMFWLTQCGSHFRKVSPLHVIKGAVVGPLGELDYYLDCQFIAVAWLFGSKLAYFSMGLFIISNIVCQLMMFSFFTYAAAFSPEANQPDMSIFKTRSFEVLHELLQASGAAYYTPELEAQKKVTIPMFVLIKFVLEDLGQAIIQGLFAFWYGGSGIVYSSICVSLSLSAFGVVTALSE